MKQNTLKSYFAYALVLSFGAYAYRSFAEESPSFLVKRKSSIRTYDSKTPIESVTHSELIDLFEKGDVEDFEPNYIYHLQFGSRKPKPQPPAPKPSPSPSPSPTPEPPPPTIAPVNDSLFNQQWSLNKTQAAQAWQRQFGNKTVRVAIIDTGVDMFHKDLLCNLEAGYNAVEPGQQPQDTHGHGTHVAGIVGACANNGLGVAGVAQVSLVPIKASANGSFYNSHIIRAIEWAVQENVDVINMSFGGPGNSTFMGEALKAASDKGILLVAAAGNESADNDVTSNYPANYDFDTMISVASTDSKDALSSFSNFGRRSVHIAAPGSNIMSTVVGGGYASMSGTSMAAPFIAGSLGLLLSHRPSLNARDAKAQLLEAVLSTSRRPTITNGRVDLSRLIQQD